MLKEIKRGNVVELTIDDIAFGGKGIAKIPTEESYFPVFVPNTIPGQKVQTKIARKRRSFAEGKLLRVLEPSPAEANLPFQPIPGAPYAALPIEEQEAIKKRTTLDVFERIGKVKDPECLLDEFISSPRTWNYRNKMEYSFSSIIFDRDKMHDVDAFGLGFKHRGTWWMVENLDRESGLFDKDFENNLINIRKWCIDSGLPAWHPPRKEGFYRYLICRKSFSQDKLLVELVTSSAGVKQFDEEGFVALLRELFGDRIAGVFHTLNDDIGDRSRSSSGNSQPMLLWGEPKITEQLLGLEFEISMESFFQPNPACAELLYDKALQYALENPPVAEGKEVIMDLFCGTGTIAQLLASSSKGQSIVGVDIIEEAIIDARKNAERNGVEDISFFASDATVFLKDYPQYKDKISTIVLDPPRGGIHPKALKLTIGLNAPRIVYVSCNPATQARDLEVIREGGYELKKFSLVDQFPHTSHIETVALFEKL